MSEFGKYINVPSRKGVFIPDITVEMFRNASLEGVEDLLASGEMEDISLPSAQPERRWIPCGERLPDRFGKMLVTFIPGTLWTYVIIANYSDLMGIAKPCFWIGNVGKSDFANITSRVVAWMPLPEPYREEKHE